MPFEQIYGFPYESPSDLPGWSLTGAPDGDQDILAERVAEQISRLDSLLQEISDSFGVFPDLIQSSAVSVTPNTQISSAFYNNDYFRGSTSVTFADAFVTTPSVIVCGLSIVPGTLIEVSAGNVTTTGFDAFVARTNMTATTVMWIASTRTA